MGGDVDFRTVARGDEDADEGSPLLTDLRSAAWLDAQELPPLRWVVPGLIPEGMSMLVGGPKIGKSWLSLDISLAVASGGKALAHVGVGPSRPVLLLALEDSDRRLQDRMRRLTDGRALPERLDYLTHTEPGAVVATVDAWLASIPTDVGDPLVIVDTLGKVMPPAGPGESAYQRDYRVAGRLKRITDDRPGMALVALHHDRKVASDDFVDNVSGTNGIAGAADTVIIIQRRRTDDEGLFKVTGRDVNEHEYRVRTDHGRWQLVGASLTEAARAAEVAHATANLDERSTRILEYVAAHAAEGVRAADVAAAVGIDTGQAHVYLNRLAKSERIARAERGLYAPVSYVSTVRSSSDGHNTQHITNRGYEGSSDSRTEPCRICGEPLHDLLLRDGTVAHPLCLDADANDHPVQRQTGDENT